MAASLMSIIRLRENIRTIGTDVLLEERFTATTMRPDLSWKDIPTFPKHFHNGSEDVVISSHIPDEPESALRDFLQFAAKHIVKGRTG